MASSRKKVDPDALFEALESFAVELPSVGPIVVQRGQKLRGSHPAVQASPGTFIEADAADDERAQARQALTPGATSEPSESHERRRRAALVSLTESVRDRDEAARRLADAEEHIASMKRKAEGEGASASEVKKALAVSPEPRVGGLKRGR